MRDVPVLFEDHTSTGFRPLSWSVPVGELRCGLLNPRERLAVVAGDEPVLLLRGYLEELARDGGHQVGVNTVRELVRDGRGLLLVAARVGANWGLLDRAVALAEQGAPVALRDDDGWLVRRVDPDAVDAVLTSWQTWQDDAAARGCWSRPGVAPPVWDAGGESEQADGAWRRIWDLVPATAAAISEDMSRLRGTIPERRIWGAIAEGDEPAPWRAAVPLEAASARGFASAVCGGDPNAVVLGPGCELARSTAIDASAGPVVIGAGVRVLPHCYLEGPLYIGSHSLVKAGSTIYGETSLGAVNKVAGEIGESTFLDFANKQHEGFIGHAYLGSWCNLGALTTNSDLKNTYGSIRVDLGDGVEDTGLRFVGLMMAEHGKTAIGTMFNTGTTVGFSSNVFGSGFPEKCLPNFTWGDRSSADRYDPARALGTAQTVLARRGCRMTPGHEVIVKELGRG